MTLSVAANAIACHDLTSLLVLIEFRDIQRGAMVLFENEVPQWCGDVNGGLVFRR